MVLAEIHVNAFTVWNKNKVDVFLRHWYRYMKVVHRKIGTLFSGFRQFCENMPLCDC